MTLRLLIRKILNEMPITKKEKFGQGSFHDIYSFNRFPDRLFKVGRRDDVEEWLKVFSAKKKLFPKVFSVKNVKDKLGLFYVEIEKLDTDRVIKEWRIMENALELAGIIDLDDLENSIDFTLQNVLVSESLFNLCKTTLRKTDMVAYNLFIKWVPFLYEVQGVVERITNRNLDLHRYNFGYSGAQMKCLDI